MRQQATAPYDVLTIRYMGWTTDGMAVFSVNASPFPYPRMLPWAELTQMLSTMRDLACDPRHPLYRMRYEMELANADAVPFEASDTSRLPPCPDNRPTFAPPWAVQAATGLPLALAP